MCTFEGSSQIICGVQHNLYAFQAQPNEFQRLGHIPMPLFIVQEKHKIVVDTLMGTH